MDATAPASGLPARRKEATAIVARMTLREKAALCSGRNFWQLKACERLGLPSIMVTDGPHGLRKQRAAADHVGLNASVPATCFPTASALAASWNVELMHAVGVALGEQCVAEGVSVLLGPGMNIKRHPLCGRNFEYFSEDPLLSGEMAAAMISGVQSRGVGTSIKHYAVNNQERNRMFVDAIVDERTLREIYLRGFEIAVKKAQPWTVMCAYNRVNGVYCSEHDVLLNRILRDEWGFEGLVMTDWGAASDRVRGVAAGLDLEMPGSGGINDERIEQAVADGALPETVLDRNLVRIVSLILCGAEVAAGRIEPDRKAHHALARRAAAESAVLLKNDGMMLPLSESADIAVIGAFARQPRYQGAGSSQVTPTAIDCPFEAMQAILGAQGRLTYAAGYDPVHSEDDEALIAAAAAAAADAAVAVVFAGLPGIYESEGFDRPHMRMPEQHNRLIEAVCAANPDTVVVLANGAPVEMPWIEAPKAVLEGYLAGQAGGSAIADLLFGRANPGGKLAETFPLALGDVPANRWFPGEHRQVQYREGLYVGYRYFDTAGLPVLFPFGHGLSYTRFDYANLSVARRGDEFLVSLDVTNAGNRAGAEIVQLYVHDVASSACRPAHELKAFARVTVEPGQTAGVTMRLDRSAFAIYDVQARDWVVEAGLFELRIGASSRDIRLTMQLSVTSGQRVSDAVRETPGPVIADKEMQVPDETFARMLGRPIPAPESVRPFHINSSVTELGQTWLGGFVRARLIALFQKRMGVDAADPTRLKMFEEMANGLPLRALALFSRGRLGFRPVHILVALLNHRYFTALRLMLGGKAKW